MSELTVENINAAEILGAAGAEENIKKVEAALAADPEVNALVKAAETVEDVFNIMKRFAKVTLEQVKVLFHKTVDFFKETKVALADEVLENVSGGGIVDWWNRNKAGIIAGAFVLAGAVVGVTIGALTFGAGAVVMGAVIGAGAGAVSAAVAHNVVKEIEKNYDLK